MEAVITSETGVNISTIQSELEDGSLLGKVVTIVDEIPLSNRNIIADIEEADVWTLRADPRIRQVERLYEMNNRAFKKTTDDVAINPVYSSFNNSTHDNWGLDFCTDQDGSNFRFSHAGTGVDVVIVDTGITPNHTEFDDANTNTRIQFIEWTANQNIDKPAHYTDTDGHGSHTAGTVAGLTQGWARDAHIYSFKIFDTDAYNSITDLALIRNWHNTKGTGRPTVVSNSWSFYSTYPDPYPPNPALAGTNHPIRVASVEAEFEDMITDGIFVVGSAGNDAHYLAAPTDPAYNDNYQTDLLGNYVASGGIFTYYYNRLTPGGCPGAFCVGSMGVYGGSQSDIATYSNRGTRVDIFAPGTYIQSALNSTATPGLLTKKSGTSMSCPQVSGIIAVYLSMNPTATLADVWEYINRNGLTGIVGGTLEGSVNLVPRSIYNGLYAKDAGTWKIIHDPQAKDAGTWKPVKQTFVKRGGQWVKIFG